MPYIKPEMRDLIRPGLREVSLYLTHPGDLTFAITYLMHLYAMAMPEPNFDRFSDALKAAECAKLEFYRVVLAPYEDEKRQENGPVSHLDWVPK